MPQAHATTHAFDATADNFEADVLDRSLQVPVLIDFWAEWCGPCKTVGPILEKLAAEYNGAFVLAKIDVDREQQLAGAFQIRSIPTIILVKGGQPVDGFPGAMPEGQLREFLAGHGIVPAAAPADDATVAEAAPADPHAEVERLRAESAAAPDNDALRLDLAVALLATGATDEAGHLLDALPANLATDDRALRARAALGFAALVGGLVLLAAVLNRWTGAGGAMAAAVIAAAAELHASIATLGSLRLGDAIDPAQGRWLMVGLLAASLATKSVLAFASGGRGYGLRVAAGLLAALAAGVAAAAFVPG